jgi:hypothetical protein
MPGAGCPKRPATLTQRARRRTIGAMIPQRRASTLAVLLAAAAGCAGAGPTAPDPQQPAARSQPGQPLTPAQIVICPQGSTYDPTRNQCYATGEPAQSPSPPPEPKSSAPRRGGATISVRCTFLNAWVSVLPVDDYPSDDTFLMQALIGLSEEPGFWSGQSQYAELEPYAARRCSGEPQSFQAAPGAHFVLAGEANTFQRRGNYQRNGYRRRVTLSGSAPTSLTIAPSDLTHTWLCISCPFVAFLDAARGAYLPAFVVLAHRRGAERRGTDRVRVARVPVRGGRVTLRVSEVEREVSHLDQLVLEVGDRTLLPAAGGARSALAAIDGVGVELPPRTGIVVDYEVPQVRDGVVDVVVVAHGHYDPLDGS